MCTWCNRFILFPLIIFILSACGGNYKNRTHSISQIVNQQKAEKRNEAIILNAVSYQGSLTTGYVIGPEDVLAIDAYHVEELQTTARVNSQGNITLPLLGTLHVQGLTVETTEQFIKKKLDTYVQEPVVTVQVKEYKSQKITIVGAVRNPKIYAVTGQMRLTDILMMAGGLTEEAGNICYVIRPTVQDENGTRKETKIIDLDEMLLNGNITLNIPLRAGDIVNVPRGGVVYVDGEVEEPGPYILTGDTTLSQALAMAKGIKVDAETDDVRIFRDNAKGEKDMIVADYDAIMDGQTPDILLVENDIIIVPRDGAKVFFKTFFGTLGRFATFGVSGTYSVF